MIPDFFRDDGKRPDGDDHNTVANGTCLGAGCDLRRYVACISFTRYQRASTSDTKKIVNIGSKKWVHALGDPRAGAYSAQRLSLTIQRGNSASVASLYRLSKYLDFCKFN